MRLIWKTKICWPKNVQPLISFYQWETNEIISIEQKIFLFLLIIFDKSCGEILLNLITLTRWPSCCFIDLYSRLNERKNFLFLNEIAKFIHKERFRMHTACKSWTLTLLFSHKIQPFNYCLLLIFCCHEIMKLGSSGVSFIQR